jgi:2'-5' RNA ligase
MNSLKNFYNLPLYNYSSTQFNLPDWLCNELFKFSLKNIQENSLHFSKTEMYPRETEFHITILYGIFDLSSNKIEELLKEYFFTDAIEVKLGKISKFDNEKYDVIKIDIFDKKNLLEELFSVFSENLENANKFPLYHPHITLTYVEKGSCDHLIGNDHFENLDIKLDVLKFSSKNPELSKFIKLNNNINKITEINNFYKFLFLK